MAPTEILAEQHFRKLVSWLQPLSVNVAWLSGSLTAKMRRQAAASAADGSVQLVVGTQALIQDHVEFHRLGLSIVDDQHRLGVGTPLALPRKGAAPQGQAVTPHTHQGAPPLPGTRAKTFSAHQHSA